MDSVTCMQALSVAELYGVLDTDTRDWTDGLLSNIFREINKPLPAGKVRPLKAVEMTNALHLGILPMFATGYAQFHDVVLHEAQLSCQKLLSLQPTAFNGPNMAHNGTVTMHIWMHTVMIALCRMRPSIWCLMVMWMLCGWRI
jgi:hypothetical protein